MTEQICSVMETMGLNYFCEGEEFIVAEYIPFRLVFHITKETLALFVEVNVDLPRQYTEEMLWYLNHKVLTNTEGNYVISENNKISFRIFTDLKYLNEVSDKRIRDILHHALWQIERDYPAMKKIAKGEYSWEEAVRVGYYGCMMWLEDILIFADE